MISSLLKSIVSVYTKLVFLYESRQPIAFSLQQKAFKTKTWLIADPPSPTTFAKAMWVKEASAYANAAS